MQQGPYIFSVHEFTRYIKTTLERERALQGVLVRGEISNCKYHSSGHLYFTLKDESSSLPCVMWRDRVFESEFRCENGQRVTAEGSVAVYERGGYYQLTVYALQAEGVGNLYLAFEQLKQKLQTEGLFSPERKRPIPQFPRRIALITSPTGAVVHDFLTVSNRRWNGRHILLIPTTVQGPQAPPAIIHALQLAAAIPNVDVIILARGGGSFEELACFNSERVARAIAASPIPVVSAIGHETDFTIADFIADLRAPTPSAAAELVIPDAQAINDFLCTMRQRIFSHTRHLLDSRKRQLGYLASHHIIRNPKALIADARQTLDQLSERIYERTRGKVRAATQTVAHIEDRIAALDPRGVLQRGYAIVTRSSDETVVATAAEGRLENTVNIQFHDGILPAEIKHE